ncbi:hypothetical protein [Telluribacter sp.]|jgi:hypothetical protein|uniref:pirin family protein n=1 Tax=Telluribacter sp. TaxID=1978767 RepID=UPI002E15700A|nr:hypothetical protein [Telluribacter sp.]
MNGQSPGKIFLSYERGQVQTPQFTRLSTFSSDSYVHENKAPIGTLYVFNEEYIAGQQEVSYTVSQASYVLLIPITGSFDFINPEAGPERLAGATIEVEELLVCTAPANTTFQIRNSYQQDIIHFLQIRIAATEPSLKSIDRIFGYSFTDLENQLLELVPGPAMDIELPFKVRLGRLAGREEAVVRLEKDSLFFCFVLSGAFEAAGRLLHENDSLVLWEVEEVELEALSENALLLVLEVQNSAPF